MLGKIEGRGRRGWQRMRWLDGITNSRDMSLSKLWRDGEGQGSLACCSPWGLQDLDTTEWLNNKMYVNVQILQYKIKFKNKRKIKIIKGYLLYVTKSAVYLIYVTCISTCTRVTNEFAVIVITQVKLASSWHSGEQQRIFAFCPFFPQTITVGFPFLQTHLPRANGAPKP